jgi:hypothetical protein
MKRPFPIGERPGRGLLSRARADHLRPERQPAGHRRRARARCGLDAGPGWEPRFRFERTPSVENRRRAAPLPAEPVSRRKYMPALSSPPALSPRWPSIAYTLSLRRAGPNGRARDRVLRSRPHITLDGPPGRAYDALVTVPSLLESVRDWDPIGSRLSKRLTTKSSTNAWYGRVKSDARHKHGVFVSPGCDGRATRVKPCNPAPYFGSSDLAALASAAFESALKQMGTYYNGNLVRTKV